ncbi:hypothetical protein SAMN05216474_0029 [Lishizhenia tianjinensis]|uniref:Uncharacterized protein n=1 Tax=Lishizhenia tianjinensis TaxID=477690 RepID=A0A1I6XAQ3_9FLAO|nr:hypothetical protein [Lishizhenia tianjinensis]SFT34894.1 hypothetical protein SAMN05216474_0029 [Lishizhenia tianjinensis]
MKLFLIALLGVFSFSLTTEIKVHSEFVKHYSTQELNTLKSMPAEDIAVMNYSITHGLSSTFEMKKVGVTPDFIMESSAFEAAKSYVELGLRIKANKTQYIQLKGSNLWVSLSSFERLKIEYQSKNRKK